MSDSNRIFLVGPMGSGKTTIGRRLAKNLQLQFVDADHELESQTGASISLIFDIEGESGFRERERRIIDVLTLRDDVVLATGGGAILDENSRKVLRERGFVVYLHADIEHLVERTKRDVNRPLLNTDDPEAKLRNLMQIREPLYREVADFTIDTGKHNLVETVKRIRQALR